MATYYVRPDGNNANAGTGPATNQAWQTIGKALGATGIASGDTVYIAPGSYNESVTIGMTSATATTSVIGDPTASQFTGVTAGPVLWTIYTSAGASPTTTSIIATSKNYLSFQNIIFDNGTVVFTTSTNTSFVNCQFTSNNLSGYMVTLSSPTSTALAATFSKCSFIGGYYAIQITGRNVADTTAVTDCLFLANTGGGTQAFNCQTLFFNNTFFCCENAGIDNNGGNASFKSNASNCLFYNNGYAIYADTSNVITQTYNRFIANTANTFNVASSVTSTTTFSHGLILPYYLQNSLGTFQMFSSIFGGPNTSAGIATGAPASDMYGVTWTGTSPDTGSATYRNLSNVTPYQPTERNASTITIAPGSTSQSIELYLGATGLTASTSGLSARYNRTRTASVSIPLVARTIAQAWSSGGFAEVDSTNMPGVYRLDVPDAALAAGASDVTIVVRGASGTNGAVLTVKLSSGGLTEAQTASAVWGASVAGYVAETNFGGVVNATRNVVGGMETQLLETPAAVWDSLTDNHGTHGTFGWGVLRADQDSKQGLVTLHSSGGVNRVDSDVHAIQNDTAAATELKGALLHNGTDYISADLLVPVTSATTLRMGPYLVKPDGGGANGALDINQGTAGNIVVQLVDATGAGINQTASTVQAKVYNAGGTLVATYTCTAEYATDGWLAIPLTTTVSGTAGTYTVTLWSTVGATVTVYGPLSMRVRAI